MLSVSEDSTLAVWQLPLEQDTQMQVRQECNACNLCLPSLPHSLHMWDISVLFTSCDPVVSATCGSHIASITHVPHAFVSYLTFEKFVAYRSCM